MGNINASIKTIKELFRLNMRIPAYQRPYRWENKNVRQLLEDIITNKVAGKQKYRIGSVILYKANKNDYHIVDGQQRITTLLLLAKVCKKQEELLNNLTYKHQDSIVGIKNNFKYIKEWIEEYNVSKEEFWEYVIEKCEFVVIEVDDLSEAFQMFDSQNGRGKELEAYNLLKAYHIRAMEQDSHDTKVFCDKRWESATMYDATPTIEGDPNIDILRQIFNEQLYRGRLWSKGIEAHKFEKSNIEEFKGFTIDKNHGINFPFQNPYLLQYLTVKFYKNILSGTVATQSRFSYGDSENIDPFVSVTQQIVNGKAFFDYIETYVEIYKQLFIDIKGFQLKDFKEFFYKYCLNYGQELGENSSPLCFKPLGYATRTGDGYLREAYKTTILLLFDKFGEKGLNRYYKTLYKLIYSERIKQSQVRYETVAKLPMQYISVINQAKDMTDLVQLDNMWATKKTEVEQSIKAQNDGLRQKIKGIDEIINLLKNN